LDKYLYYSEDSIVLYCCDCREILPKLPKVDLVLTDPPYGIGYKPQKHNSRRSMGDRNFCATDQLTGDTGLLDFDARPIYEQFKASGQVWWGANNYADSLPRSRGWLVWYKADGMEKTDFSHADMAWTNRDMPIRGRNYLWMGMCKAGEKERAQHPTQKPVNIMQWSISFFPGCRTILDPFSGSGTTLVAAKHLGRRAIGIEIEEKYCAITKRRLGQGVLPL
jgi:DNA modification methylase